VSVLIPKSWVGMEPEYHRAVSVLGARVLEILRYPRLVSQPGLWPIIDKVADYDLLFATARELGLLDEVRP